MAVGDASTSSNIEVETSLPLGSGRVSGFAAGLFLRYSSRMGLDGGRVASAAGCEGLLRKKLKIVRVCL